MRPQPWELQGSERLEVRYLLDRGRIHAGGVTLIDPQFLAIAMIQRLWGQSFLRSRAATIVAVGHG